MAVQMAPPANDLAQVCAPAKNAMVFAERNAEFKNILRGMRETKQQTTSRAVPGEPKTRVNFARAANLDEPADARPAELEKTPDDGGQDAPPPSRFDPDVFLEALMKGTVTDKSDKLPADKDKAEDAESDGTAPEDAEAPLETPAPDSGENKTRSSAEGDALATPAETNAETEADAKKLSEATSERPARTEKGTLATPAETNAETEADAKKFSDADAGKSFPERSSTEKSSQASAERAAGPQTPSAGTFDGQIRAEIRPVSQAPVVYTLTSADKFGEGLRSVMTIMTRGDAAEARVVVEPPALGRVDISLLSSESGVEANFRVDNEELRQMVQKQLDSLKESLHAQGIHVSGVTVDIRNNEGDRNRGNAAASKKGRRSARPGEAGLGEDIGDETRVLRLDLEKGLLHWVA
ncbi:MAG: flagellar hook-length control protein FliK [Synergistaceae bacterium]|jgi:flagellar hook-length control protein FliK|nr:flagellar hook-length control protein FliK [Synergistaceae bacterium]